MCLQNYYRESSCISYTVLHKVVSNACNQCDYKAIMQGSLICHIRSVNEGVNYDCNQCDYRATMQGSLTCHIQSVYEGVKYDCNKCEYRGNMESNLTCHKKSLYEYLVLCSKIVHYVLFLGITDNQSKSSIIQGEKYYTNMKFI